MSEEVPKPLQTGDSTKEIEQPKNPEAQKRAIFDDAKRVFSEVDEKYEDYWSRFDELAPEEVDELNLDNREKYEALKRLQEGSVNELLDKLDEDMLECKTFIAQARESGSKSGLVEFWVKDVQRFAKSFEQLKKLKEAIGVIYSINLRERDLNRDEDKEKSRKRNMMREARHIFLEYNFDGEQSGGCYNALKAMKDGHPEQAIYFLEGAIAICKDVASAHLDNTYGDADIEESHRKQDEYVNIRAFIRTIKKEYAIPIEMTPALRREFAGKAVIKENHKKKK